MPFTIILDIMFFAGLFLYVRFGMLASHAKRTETDSKRAHRNTIGFLIGCALMVIPLLYRYFT